MALPDQLVGAPVESLTDFDAETAHDGSLEILWDEPAIGARPLDNAGAEMRLQAPHWVSTKVS
jgi:hypothetical protein